MAKGGRSQRYSGYMEVLGGVPVMGNLPLVLPHTLSTYPHGRYFFVGKGGNDGADGRTWESRFATIDTATTAVNASIDWSANPWAPGDVIVIGPGKYAENLTALAYGATYYGLGVDTRDAQTGVKIIPASGSAVVVTSCINNQFHNIGFEADSASGSYAFDANNCNNTRFYNCLFTGPAETYTTGAAVQVSDATATHWIGCQFMNADKGLWVDYVDGGDKFAHNVIDDCIFEGLDTAGIQIDSGIVIAGSVVRNSDFTGGATTMAAGIVINANGLAVNRCTFQVTAGASSSGAQVVQANGCYVNGALADTDLV